MLYSSSFQDKRKKKRRPEGILDSVLYPKSLNEQLMSKDKQFDWMMDQCRNKSLPVDDDDMGVKLMKKPLQSLAHDD